MIKAYSTLFHLVVHPTKLVAFADNWSLVIDCLTFDHLINLSVSLCLVLFENVQLHLFTCSHKFLSHREGRGHVFMLIR